ncbi:sulfotransferase, putative [Ixodes scapularis]|uniref:Sulfotransferase, putative n=1 Tax=Ixodes scapularis TaxID=6945 RepID=B7Q0E9_IXOSC|nr:sulfotransferase, putative [Ixodes scapularis]|eukprot:XP_002407494.1 sulfotransferase, putative [Ixodes scapularis]
MRKKVYRDVGGLYLSPGFHEACVRSALSYKPLPGDVFIVSYPKCGTTWMQHIVYNILNGHPPPSSMMDCSEQMPFLEFQGAESAWKMPRPGAIKTHMPFHLHPFSTSAKYFYICRNPYDCCVSFYHHTRRVPEYDFQDGTFDEFFEMFVNGKADFGDYFDHLMSWYAHRNDPNVLFLTYEALKKDTATWVLKIASFLGEGYGDKLRGDHESLNGILKKTRFESMKRNVDEATKSFYQEIESTPDNKKPLWARLVKDAIGESTMQKPKTGDFMRRGVIGDWKNHFSLQHVKRLKERIVAKTGGTDIMDLWRDIDLP